MASEKQVAIQALSSAGFERSDYHFEKRPRFTSVKFRYGITKERILAKAEQLASALSVCLCPHSEEENYLMVYCHLPQENWPAGLYVVCQRSLRVASLLEAATISRSYREQMQAKRASRIARLGYDNEWEVEQLSLFGDEE